MRPFVDTNVISQPGVYTIPEEQYHADPALEPSLSSHIAQLIVTRSPLHGWFAHPRLNDKYEEKQSEDFDVGSAAHALLLEGEDRMAVIPFDSWRKDAAKAARDAARNAGKYPVLADSYERVVAMRDVALKAIADNPDFSGLTLADGKPEQTIIWKWRGIYCRARVDWMSHDRKLRLDYKTTKASANPRAWVRTMLGMGAHLQDAFYAQGNAATEGPVDGGMGVFLVQEQQEPFACCFQGLEPSFRAIADGEVRRAQELYQECLQTGNWPGYPKRTCWLEAPPWLLSQHSEEPIEDEGGIPYDPAQLFGDRAK